MKFDPNNKETTVFVDEHNILLRPNPSWKPDGDFGEGDCIGRTFDGYLAWEDNENYITWGKEKFINAVINCFPWKTDEKGVYIQGYRHPNRIDNEYNDMSRDHTIYALAFMKYVNSEFLNDMVDNLRWRISDKFTFTPDSWLWMKALTGNMFRRFLYYLVSIPVMVISVLWNKFIYKMGGFSEESHQDDWVLVQNQDQPKRVLKWRKLGYPLYAMRQVAIQLYVLPDSFLKRVMQKVTLWGTPKHNYEMQILLGAEPNSDDVYGYKSMTGDRFSTVLNEVNDRSVHIITDPVLLEANVLDVDRLRALYVKNIK